MSVATRDKMDLLEGVYKNSYDKTNKLFARYGVTVTSIKNRGSSILINYSAPNGCSLQSKDAVVEMGGQRYNMNKGRDIRDAFKFSYKLPLSLLGIDRDDVLFECDIRKKEVWTEDQFNKVVQEQNNE